MTAPVLVYKGPSQGHKVSESESSSVELVYITEHSAMVALTPPMQRTGSHDLVANSISCFWTRMALGHWFSTWESNDPFTEVA